MSDWKSEWSQVTTFNGSNAGPHSHHHKRGILSRFLGKKDKEEGGSSPPLKHLPGSVRSLQTTGTRSEDKPQGSPDSRQWSREGSISNSEVTLTLPNIDNGQFGRPSTSRQGTFTKLPFAKKGKGGRSHDDHDRPVDPTQRNNSVASAAIFDLDTNLSNMEGILAHPPTLTPLDNSIFAGNVEDEAKIEAEGGAGIPGWNAPDSWAVKKVNDENMSRLPEIDEAGVPRKADEKTIPFCIRIFRGDGTFATLSMNLNATVTEVINQLGKKTYMPNSLDNYQIIMKKHDLQRILGPGERPVVIQKRLLEQAGYEERDKLEDVGREDNSYLCRFLFVPTRESGYAVISQDPGLSRVQKFSHVDLSGRNLITIPIALYGKAAEIISLNLSRNLSLDLPKDFIQSCVNLRDIKYISNEAWKLPPSLSWASRLTILDVSNNRLEQLEHAELYRLQGLISLKLANNRLTHLPSYFGAFKSMRTLNVSSNFLDTFPTFLCDLEGLVDIDMSFNAISAIPDEIGNLKSLERFVITNNRISGSLPESFSQLFNLKEVDVRYNALSSIDVIAALPRVEQLSADHNSISVFEGTFEKIRVLRLNSNPVTRFEIMNPVPTLTTLILSNAKLAHIPDAAFDKMPNLVKLVLDKNHFVSLPHHVGKLRKLEHFSIARNALSSLPPEIGCLTELRFLDVRQNNLKKLPMEIWWAGKLETLNISSNVLDNFPKPGSRPPQIPGEPPPTVTEKSLNGTPAQTPSLSQNPSYEELGPLEAFGQRRPSQASGGHLIVGSSPPGSGDRKGSMNSIYGKSGRQTSIISRTTSGSTLGAMTPPSTATRKDSTISEKLFNTFAGSLRNLYLADNQLDDDVFDEITLLKELRLLNLSYNDINDIPQRSLRSWPQLVELYLSGNELSSLPSDDFEEFSLLQVLHLNSNKFQTLPAEFSKAKRLAVLDCGSNSLKYNVSNWPYDWNWNFNPNLKYLNLSGNKRLEIKPNLPYGDGPNIRERRHLTDFSALEHLRILGLMDVTLTIPTIPDETEDRRVRTSGSLAGSLAYGMADSLGRNEHLSTIDMVVPRFNSNESETLLGMFDGQALSSGGSKIAKYLHENFGKTFSAELKRINPAVKETPVDALRRTFLSLNKDLATAAIQATEERSLLSHRGSAAPAVLSRADLHSGGVATVMFLQQMELYVANVGDAQAMLIHSEGGHRILTRKHDPAEPNERQRIRDAGGWVSRQGKLNDILEVSRAFGYVQLMPAVQAAPHITQVTLKDTDEMLIIASRELWEYLSPDLIVDVARSERSDLMRAAQRLRDLAMAFGATGKIMVMMIGLGDLKKRERYRLNRGTSMSMGPSSLTDEAYFPTKRGRKAKGQAVDDSNLRRLDDEVQAPVGDISLVFTDIKGSTALWDNYPQAMRAAMKLHNEVMRRQLRIIGGYEVKTEGDAFMVSFPTATSALLWAFAVQAQLLEVQWPSEILNSAAGKEIFDNDQNLIFRGLSVRMGIHWGNPVCENDPVTKRMDYFGPMVNKASRISSVADGGQIAVSTDFISEIQRYWEAFPDSDRSGSTGSEETFENDLFAQTIRRELNSLSLQGYEIKDMGERKLKGLENPEFIYLMYPHSLAGRIYHQPRLQIDAGEEKEDAKAPPAQETKTEETHVKEWATKLAIEPESVWALWKISLRLEMLCTQLEEGKDALLRGPNLEMMEKTKIMGGEVSDDFLIGFLTHLITRTEVSFTLAHIAFSLSYYQFLFTNPPALRPR
jgi:adenylate cyclase